MSYNYQMMNTQIRRIVGSLYPLIVFWRYWDTLDCDYTRSDILWGIGVTVAFALAIYLYFPLAKKVERGSGLWFLGLFTIIYLVKHGLVLMGVWVDLPSKYLPVEQIAWGHYMLFSAFFIPILHMSAKGSHTLSKMTLLKGNPRWNRP